MTKSNHKSATMTSAVKQFKSSPSLTKSVLHPLTPSVALIVGTCSALLRPAEAIQGLDFDGIPKGTIRALAIVAKFTSALGIIGAVSVAAEILRKKNRRESSYHRIVLGMSGFMTVYSLATFMSTWPIEAGAPNTWGNVGTMTTCNTQGLMIQLGVGIPLYSSCLAIHFLLNIKYNYTEDKLRRVERYMHVIVLTFSFGTAIAGVFLELYNNATLWCDINPEPTDCYQNRDACTRGSRAISYVWYFYYIPTWFVTIAVTIIMIAVYRTIRAREDATRQYTTHTIQEDQRRKCSRMVAIQAMLYVGAYYITWLPGTAGEMLLFLGIGNPQPVLVVEAIFSPMYGLFHVFVYMGPRSKRCRLTMSRLSNTLCQVLERTTTTCCWSSSKRNVKRKVSAIDCDPNEVEPTQPGEIPQSVEVDGESVHAGDSSRC